MSDSQLPKQTFSWGSQVPLTSTLSAIAYSGGAYSPSPLYSGQTFTIEIDNTTNGQPVTILLEKEQNADTSLETINETIVAGQCKFIGGLSYENLNWIKGKIAAGTGSVQITVWSGSGAGSGGIMNPNNPYINPTRTKGINFTSGMYGASGFAASQTNATIISLTGGPTWNQYGNVNSIEPENIQIFIGQIVITGYASSLTLTLFDNATSVATYTVTANGTVYFMLIAIQGHTATLSYTTNSTGAGSYTYMGLFSMLEVVLTVDSGYMLQSTKVGVYGMPIGTATPVGLTYYNAPLPQSVITAPTAGTVITVIDTTGACFGYNVIPPTLTLPVGVIGTSSSATQVVPISFSFTEVYPS